MLVTKTTRPARRKALTAPLPHTAALYLLHCRVGARQADTLLHLLSPSAVCTVDGPSLRAGLSTNLLCRDPPLSPYRAHCGWGAWTSRLGRRRRCWQRPPTRHRGGHSCPLLTLRNSRHNVAYCHRHCADHEPLIENEIGGCRRGEQDNGCR